VKRFCASLLEKKGSFKYTRETLDILDEEIRTEAEKFGPNPILKDLLDSFLDWKVNSE
jgi:geranylgeranyl diphosphate synthase type 3